MNNNKGNNNQKNQRYRKNKVRTNDSFGNKLTKLRHKIVESGRPLLTWDEINEEVAKRRGKLK